MALHNGHNFYFDLFEEESPEAGSFTEESPEAGSFTEESPTSGSYTRRGREHYTVEEIGTVSVAKVSDNEAGDLTHGNEQG